ncbi:MAG TPA: hypothetical protein VGU72_09730 [Beijerinckiaceae bacterium]|jgi:hypothetical protein|nr:hypothetical protein [Beijerinckiaceae bacterium]
MSTLESFYAFSSLLGFAAIFGGCEICRSIVHQRRRARRYPKGGDQ